ALSAEPNLSAVRLLTAAGRSNPNVCFRPIADVAAHIMLAA
ncbi:MAG: hypothetical protein AVDCRST_MAG93-8657, partial [uncultured Chloroflexia bacterium]